MKQWRRWGIAAFVLAGVVWAGGSLWGLHLTDTGALRVPGVGSNPLYIVREEPTWFGKCVLFADLDHGSFGVAHLQRTLLFFWRNGGGSYGAVLEPGQPFRATGFTSANARATQQFVIGVKADQQIRYIVVGSEEPQPGTALEPARLTLEHVQSLPNLYHATPVVNGYALLVVDEFTAATYTVHAFDTTGRLVADQPYAHDVRWLR